MRLAVFSDTHGNLPALEAMLGDAGEVDGYISLGDIVNYGPWSNECVDRICGLPNVIKVRGNHDEYFRDGSYPGASALVAEFFDATYPTFTRHATLPTLTECYELRGFAFRHTILGQYIYPDTELTLSENVVIGHSHHQFKRESGRHVIYNAGSVGQNRAYIDVANYLMCETETMEFECRALSYDIDVVIQEMRVRRYPEQCIAYYSTKKRLGG